MHDWLVRILTLTTLLSLGVAVYFYFRSARAVRKKQLAEQKTRELSARFDEVHLGSIEGRLSPHLFKNILNSIQSHAYQTWFALDKLANVLDYILYESRHKFVTPREEVAFALDLIEINRIKISPLFELNVKTRLHEEDPLFNQRLIAPLISIDLIENAFKHADLESADSFIQIVFEFRDQSFMLTVSNKISPRSGLPKEKGGIGGRSLEERLRIIYKDHFKLERFVEGDVHIAHLKIDLFEHKAAMLAT